ncbi:ABC transporter ATP-binding protein [Enterococcus florum]|uniref:ABC transporter ATP-binding protein n=1 Tax=Enterococcus florum TaxID=2480627 RepID=A0A4P5PFK8_9ENTE|nr:ABC transporter ATP-binding protein [Enterococcus florum]GCF95191.1 ABC transporter ATP-binding protein [Enterococcus florum]
MLTIQDLSVRYAGNAALSVDQFQLRLNDGEIGCIVGESGSGKSTVLKAVLGALPEKTSIMGQVDFNGRSLLQQTPAEWLNMRGTTFSMIFQDSNASLNPIRKIGKQYEEYILQHKQLTLTEARQLAEETLIKMQLKDAKGIMDSYPHQLSGGMCQRVGIAMAMTFQPELLLADEPTSALDVVTQEQIVEELLRVRNVFNTSILLVTHHLAMAAYMADQLIVMEKGRIVDQGFVLEVIDHPQSPYTETLLASVPELKGEFYG